MTRFSFFAVLLCLCALACHAVKAEDDTAARQKLIQAITSEGDEQQKLIIDFINTPTKLAHDTLVSWKQSEICTYETPNNGPKVLVVLEDNSGGKSRAIRLDTGKPLVDDKGTDLMFDSGDLTSVDTDMRTTGVIQQVLDMFDLSDPDEAKRDTAVQKIGKSKKPEYVPVLQARLDKETSSRVKKSIQIGLANLNLADKDPTVKIKAINELSNLHAIGSLDDLRKLAAAQDTDPAVVKAANAAAKSIASYMSVTTFFGTIFHGISWGSILLVVSLGLAITFGLMGIINMAHGEMIAIGGYTCYVVENIFRDGWVFTLPFMKHSITVGGFHATPGSAFYESYFLWVIPLSFIMSASAGLLLERCVIQFLYRRPLESLLATYGVSLCMQQCFKFIFGANNVQINSPRWLNGNFTAFDIIFGYNRLFVIAFAVLIVIGTWLLLSKTPLGLLIRAVMQNRDMASCMGVPTSRVNMLTFAFGSGLAGLAGAFLSQITNVGPSMGQQWIVNSFMTVVVGGVGNIIGCIYAALGIGTADQVLQQVFGSPVIGEITVLISIILFLQWKPGGLFPTRSRSLEG